MEQGWTHGELAARVARDLPDGAYVNLGIGMPTMVSSYVSPEKEVIFHSENGILGLGPATKPEDQDFDLINAGKQPVSLLAGGAFFHHADSFGMMRGGHLDICVLGGFQVSFDGDLANWSTGEPGAIPAVGGAMDLAVGAKETWVMMRLLTAQGAPKVVPVCTYPLTAPRCVTRVYSDHGVFSCGKAGLALIEAAPGVNGDELLRLVGLTLAQDKT